MTAKTRGKLFAELAQELRYALAGEMNRGKLQAIRKRLEWYRNEAMELGSLPLKDLIFIVATLNPASIQQIPRVRGFDFSYFAHFCLMAGEAIAQLAEHRPTLELEAALPHLGYRTPYTPLEFLMIRSRVAKALRPLRGNLPIAATAPETNASDLPKPATGSETIANLPRPSKKGGE